MIQRFRKKPVVVEAVLWDGENFDLLSEFGLDGHWGLSWTRARPFKFSPWKGP